VNAPWSLAAVLAASEPERLYSGLSLLVSAAADGRPCGGLATFRALELLLGTSDRDDKFARSFAELRDTALELEGLELYACSASVETIGIARETIEERLDGVMSTPSFLRRAEGATLLFV